MQVIMKQPLLYTCPYQENSYIESSWKCTKGSIQIAKSLQEIIQQHGGQVLRNQEVIQIQETNGVIASVTTSQQQQFKADVLISNLHPGLTYSLLDTKVIKPITRKRILSPQYRFGIDGQYYLATQENTLPKQQYLLS
ncbi:MAG: FAD-dependent oxidoreductase [Bacteroidetes bacterium]|nr:FAD-dependent oxidoreductase [Bacteroidota bacterium]